jgi:hypothetical protein
VLRPNGRLVVVGEGGDHFRRSSAIRTWDADRREWLGAQASRLPERLSAVRRFAN